MLLVQGLRAGWRGLMRGLGLRLPSIPTFSIVDRSLYCELFYPTCGTHFGATKEPASIVLSPVLASLCTSSIFVSAGMLVFSFCKPSLGPTSIIRTWSAAAREVVEKVRRERWRKARRAMGWAKDISAGTSSGRTNIPFKRSWSVNTAARHHHQLYTGDLRGDFMPMSPPILSVLQYTTTRNAPLQQWPQH